ncbi:hypothetical protein NC653_018978 [Populus alba x Populus x berolinensis]|uniref:Uncharacterized protein n=1 Tax=Populus alba x Populus x berolinensis TaxID=444605 RepID=A0AAD6QHP5_9ROSI|nr:hypothetical protein NC653_018978 [Populus alba x Populus x berolinensis]
MAIKPLAILVYTVVIGTQLRFRRHTRVAIMIQILSYYEKSIAWFSIRSWAAMKIPDRDLCSWNV